MDRVRRRRTCAGIATAGLAASVLAATAGGEPAPAPARLAFAADGQIFTIDARGAGRTQLTHGRTAVQSAWSPDGAHIAFVRDESRKGGDRSRIWTMRADGGDPRPLTARPRNGVIQSDPAWSPDGGRLAFASARFTEDSLLVRVATVAADGSDERTVVSETARHRLISVSGPVWSPDGARLMYTRVRLDRNSYFRPSIYAVDADGSGRRLVAADAAGAAWSPDGRSIAFASVRDRNGSTCGSDECSYDGEIYTARPDGSDPRRLTSTKADESDPAWSPDGRRIAFHSDRNYPEGEGPEIYTMKPDGGCVTWLTNGTARSESPAWEPGAEHSSDAGACGDAAGPPRVETRTDRIASFTGFKAYWLGAVTEDGLLLSQAGVGRRRLDLLYYDCGRFDPARCPSTADVQEAPICRSHPFLFSDLRPRVSILRGALLFEPRDPESATELYTGATSIRIFGGDRADARRVAGALQPVNGPPAEGLPRASIPKRTWRALRRTEAALRRTGSAAAAGRALGISRYAVRRRVALLRKLRTLGPVGRLRCGH